MTKRIAMWSGPRNLSTAMMYSFGARSDTEVIDEPFYAAYLAATGADHPMRKEVLSGQPQDPAAVASDLAKSGSNKRYFKLMAHHMLPDFPLDWAQDAVHIHLLRHPARVIASYSAKREMPTVEDIGFPQQVELIRRLGGVVVDSCDIRRDPEGMLKALCSHIGIAFDPAMLSWPKGPKAFDGAWAPHWYDAVHKSTGFAGPEDSVPILNGKAKALEEQALVYYNKAKSMSLTGPIA